MACKVITVAKNVAVWIGRVRAITGATASQSTGSVKMSYNSFRLILGWHRFRTGTSTAAAAITPAMACARARSHRSQPGVMGTKRACIHHHLLSPRLSISVLFTLLYFVFLSLIATRSGFLPSCHRLTNALNVSFLYPPPPHIRPLCTRPNWSNAYDDCMIMYSKYYKIHMRPNIKFGWPLLFFFFYSGRSAGYAILWLRIDFARCGRGWSAWNDASGIRTKRTADSIDSFDGSPMLYWKPIFRDRVIAS